MVDLPGYGYAQVPEAVRAHWVKLLGDYLQTRKQLIGLVLIMDVRHPMKPLDIQMLDFFALTGRPVHILLSKADKLSKNEQIKTLAAVQKALKPFAERQSVSVQLFSSLKNKARTKSTKWWRAGLRLFRLPMPGAKNTMPRAHSLAFARPFCQPNRARRLSGSLKML